MKHIIRLTVALLISGSFTVILSTYTWQSIPFPYTSEIKSVAINPDGHIFVGTEGADPNMIYKTEDNGATWVPSAWDYQEVTNPFNPDPAVINIPDIKQLLITQTGIIYAVAEGLTPDHDYSLQNGLFRSKDNGATWEWLWYDPFGSHFDAALNSNGVVYLAPYVEIYYSNDDGDTWVCCGVSCPLIEEGNGTYIGPHEVNNCGQIITYDRFYSTDGWKTIPPPPARCLAISGTTLFYGGDDGIYESEGLDQSSGDTWIPLTLSGTRINDLFINNFIFAATENGVWGPIDAGWNQLDLAGQDVIEINMIDLNQIIARTSLNTLYLGTLNAPEASIALTYPNGNNIQLEKLEEYFITWNSVGDVSEEIFLKLYKGNTYISYIHNNFDDFIIQNDGSFRWFVNRCLEPSNEYRIKIETETVDRYLNYMGASFSIIENTAIPDPKMYTAIRAGQFYIPAVDGYLNDPIWSYANEAWLNVGGNPGDFNTAWTSTSDNNVSWKAVWSDITNKVYVAISVSDDVRGTFDNRETDAFYSPAQDESIEIFTDGDRVCVNYWDRYNHAQFWRVTEENQRNLLHYPTTGDHPYTGTDFITAVQQGTYGNWTCEIEFTIYDGYPHVPKTLSLGDTIGWDIWYNDSDDETRDGYYKMDHQVGWNYQGEVWKQTDFMGYLKFIEHILPLAVKEENAIPVQYFINQNYPNPFNPATTIEYRLPRTAHVHLILYDIRGRKVKELVNGIRKAGIHRIALDASFLCSGIYYYTIRTPGFTQSKKIILIK